MSTLFTVGIEVQASAAQQAVIRLERAFNQLASGSEAAQQAAKSVGREFDTASKQVSKLADEFEATNRRQQEFERGALAVSAAMAGLAYKAKQYIQSVVGVGQATQGAIAANSTLAKDAAGLDKTFRALTKELNYSTNSLELNKAAYDVLSAGVSDTADVMNVMKAGVAGAKGGFSDLATITDAVTTIMNSYGKSASEAQTIVDQMIVTQNDGKIVAGQYGKQIGIVAAGAASAGVKLEELNAAIALVTVAGVPISSTFTGLRQAISSIISPSEQAKKVAKELGVDFSQTALKSKGFAGVLKDVADATKGNAEQITKLFGSVEAKAALDPILNDLPRYTQFLENQTKAAGASAVATDKVTKGLEAAQAALANISVEASRDVFEIIAPAVTALTNASTGLAKAFVDLPEPMKKVAIGIGVITAGVLGLSAAVIAFNALGLTTAAIMGGLSAAFAVITGPIGLAAIAIGGVYLAFVQLMESSEKARKVVSESMERMGKVTDRIFTAFGKILGSVSEKLSGFVEGAQKQLGDFGNWFAEFVDNTVSGWERIASIIESATSKQIQSDLDSTTKRMSVVLSEIRKNEQEIRKTQNAYGIPNVQAQDNLKALRAEYKELQKELDRARVRQEEAENKSLKATEKKVEAKKTEAKLEAAATSPMDTAKEDKKLEQERLRAEQELTNKRKTEFEELLRKEKASFQDRNQFESATFSQKTSFELQLFDLRRKHEELLQQDRMDFESEIARAVVDNVRKEQALRSEIARNELRHKYEVAGLELGIKQTQNQRNLEITQQRRTDTFNQGQYVTSVADAIGAGGSASFSGAFGQDTLMALAGQAGLRKNRARGNHFGSIRSGSKGHHGSGNAVDFGDAEQGVSRSEAHKKLTGFLKTLISSGAAVNIEEIIWNGAGSPLGDYAATGGKGPFNKMVNGKMVPIGAGLAKTHTDHLHMAETTRGGGAGSAKSGGGGAKKVPYYDQIIKAANKYGIDPFLYLGLVQQESGFRANASSPAGAYGLSQLMPGTARGLGVNPKDPLQNLDGGARYLSQQMKAFGGNTSLALAAYNAGPGNVQKHGGIPPFKETQNYVKSVTGNAAKFRQMYGGGMGAGTEGTTQPYALANSGGVPTTMFAIQKQQNDLAYKQLAHTLDQKLLEEQLVNIAKERGQIVTRIVEDKLEGLEADTNALQEQAKLLTLEGEGRKDYLAQLEYQKLIGDDLLKLEQDIKEAQSMEERNALQEAYNKLKSQEAEFVAAIAVNQAARDQLERQQKQTEWVDSNIESLKQMNYGLGELSLQSQQAMEYADGMGNAFGDAFGKFITGSATAKEAFAGFMSGMANMFAQSVQKMVATAVTNNLFPGILNMFGGGGQASLFGGGFGGGGGGFNLGGITGGVASGISLPAFTPFADGGIVTRPTLGLVGEAGPEAIIPLDQLGGGGGGVSSVVNVTVNNDGSTSTNSSQGNELGKAIQRAVTDEIARQKRPGGLLATVR